MINFDDMTLEELQQLLNVNTKNPNEVNRIQEISGLTGKAVDGIWGKQTSKAWNNFLDENQSDIEQAIHDEQKFQNAMANGQKSPAVEDIISYSEQLDEQNSYRNEKISQLEQQIALVKERIVRNTRTLTGKSYEDVNNQLAALEMKKINSQDPSMLWRWQNQRQDTKNANANVQSNAAEQFKNKVNMWNRTNPSSTTEGVEQQISNINAAILEGDNIGADVSGLYKKKKELENYISGKGIGTTTEKINADLNALLKSAETSAELIEFQNTYKGSLKHGQNSEINLKIKELQKKEKANSDEAAVKNWYENMNGKGSWSQISESVKASYRKAYRDENGVK